MTTLTELIPTRLSGYWGVDPGASDVDARAIRNGDVGTSGELRWAALPVRSYSSREFAKAQVHAGDLMITTSGNCGNVAYIGTEPIEPTVATNFVRILRSRPEVADSRYVYHFMRTWTFRRGIAPFVRGATIQNLSVDNAFTAIEIPVPSLREQRRIAAILDRADALHAKCNQVLAHLDALRQSVFRTMFGCKDFEVVLLKDAIKWSSGRFLPAKNQKGGPHPVYGGNGINGSHDEYMYAERRLVVGRVGAYCGAVHVTQPFAWVTDNALVATFLRHDLTLDYLLPALTGANLNRYAGVSGQPSISGGKIASVQLSLPPMSLQREFADRVSSIESQRNVVLLTRSAYQDLFASLQTRAFAGTL